ncbi:hypothetical protein LINPERHAP1_LOCUS23129 [Linum perenne]
MHPSRTQLYQSVGSQGFDIKRCSTREAYKTTLITHEDESAATTCHRIRRGLVVAPNATSDCLLLDSSTPRSALLDGDDDVPRPLPHDREVYRRGFLFNTTQTNGVNCINMLRMRRKIFWKLCKVLEECGILTRMRSVEVDEMVTMLLLTVGNNAKNRTCQVLFHRSGETVSRTIHCVLAAILSLQTMMLAKPSPGCLGALDDTIVNALTTTESKARNHTMKGSMSINCLGVVNQSLQFTYCLVGWEGSSHDRESYEMPFQGNYYLVDAGYMNASGVLAPYRGQRYHLQEWGANRPRSAKDFFNMKHSKARNVVKCAFRILKM